MSDWPDSKETFLERFKEREPRWALELIATRCNVGDISVCGTDGTVWYKLVRHGDWGALTNIMYDSYVLAGGRFGWVTDEGDYLSCDHAGHDRLLLLLGRDIHKAEGEWVRVSMSRVQLWDREPNAKQIAKLMELVEGGVMMPGAAANFARRLAEGWVD